ncbi:hypothetical protein HZA73_01070 [candidate division TA06 bacterium]|nr:hypothetical protein [candidate division TA06 bacterium]
MRKKQLTKLIIEASNTFKQYGKYVLTFTEIKKIIDDNNERWGIPTSKSYRSVINDLVEHTPLKKWEFSFPAQKEIKYTYGEVSDLELLSLLKKNSFFCYYTAMYLHNLTEQRPTTYYINVEQTPKFSSSDNILMQDRIDMAFKNKPRSTNNIAEYKNYKIYMISGKASHKLGVIDYKNDNIQVKVTDLERTLLDATVRPEYSGGVFEVMKAYKNAVGKISIKKLYDYLKKMDYIYPYHQCIGFYLEKTNLVNQQDLNIFHKKGIKYNFYLAHGFKKLDYSDRWKLYYPKGF